MNEPTAKPQGFFENVPPKFTFIFGLVIGIAAFSLFGYISLLSRVSADGTAKATNTASVNSNNDGQVAGDTNNSNTAAAPVSVKPVSDADYIRGNKDAKVTLLSYSDLECPYCKTFHETVQQVMSAYPNDVRVVYRHFPLSFHVNAQKEAEAAECVAEQGGNEAYWKFIDAVFTRTTSNGTGFALDKLAPLAKEVGVNQNTFTSCLDSGKYGAKVSTDLSEGSAAGVSGTPTSFVLDASGNVVETIPGALSFAQVDTIIKTALAK